MSNARGRDRPPVEARVCRAIRLLAEGLPADTVAQKVRVMPETLDRWQALDDFRALLACMRENGRMRDALDQLDALTPDAIEALRRALANDNDRIAVGAARDVLDRVGVIRRAGRHTGENDEPTEQVIRLEYVNPTGTPYAASPWAERHPRAPGAVQGGGVRSAVGEDDGGDDSAD